MPAANTIPLEKSITAAVLRYLKDLPNCHAHKVHGGPYGESGEPDIDACIRGRAVKIEVKRPISSSKLPAGQQRALERWRYAGALAFVARSVSDVREVLESEGLV